LLKLHYTNLLLTVLYFNNLKFAYHFDAANQVMNLNQLKKVTLFTYFDHNFVSKWIILLIDMMLIAFSLIVSFALLNNSALHEISMIEYYKGLIGTLMFSVVGHFVFKPHRGIIRHTSLVDIKRVFFARTLSFALNLSFILFVSDWLNLSDYRLPFSVASLNYVISLYFLTQFRLAIKYTFNLGKKSKVKPRIMIYGAGKAGHLTFDALESSYEIVAFIDDNPSKSHKFYKGVTILNPKDNIHEFIAKKGVSQIVISVQNCTPKERKSILSRCMDWHLEVKAVPPIEHWVNGELTKSQIKSVNIEDLLGRDVIQLENEALNQYFKGKSILVTGAAGSIGSEVARQLAFYKPSRLILLDQAETPLYHLELEMNSTYLDADTQLEVVLANISDRRSMESVFKNFKIDYVYHAAAYKHVPSMEMNPVQAVQVNILGTQIVADLADEYGITKMVLVSTDKAVNPTNVMGASKRCAEMYVQSKDKLSNTKYITTRFGNVLGSNGSVIPLFKKQLAAGGPLTVTHPEITRYFMTIPEACQLVLEAGHMGKGGEIFVFDMGESVRIVDLAKKMIHLSGLEPEKDIKIVFTGLRPGEKLYEELLTSAETVLPTHHEKIMRAKVSEHKHSEVKFMLKNMQELIEIDAVDEALVSCIKQLVPEYISQNSRFSKLDQPKNRS
jgi:FlaA1/EpsC-like NDP-sugar epimerase